MDNLKERILKALNNALHLCDINVTSSEKLAAAGMTSLLGPFCNHAEARDTRIEVHKLIAKELCKDHFKGSLMDELSRMYPGQENFRISQKWFKFWAEWAAKNLLPGMYPDDISRLHPYIKSVYRNTRDAPPLTDAERDILEAVNVVVHLVQRGLARPADLASEGLCNLMEIVRLVAEPEAVSATITRIMQQRFNTMSGCDRTYVINLLRKQNPGANAEGLADLWLNFWIDWVIEDCLHRIPEDGVHFAVHPKIRAEAHLRRLK